MIRRSNSSQNLDLARRAALRIRLVTALSFRDGGLPAGSGTQQWQTVHGVLLAASNLPLANPALVTAPSADLGGVVRRAVQMVWNAATPPVTPVIASRVAALKAQFDNFNCAHCAGNSKALMACRAEFDELLESVDRVVAKAYGPHLRSARVTAPALVLAMTPLAQQQTGDLLQHSAVRANCRFQDPPGGSLSIITLEIRDGGFDWSSLCHLPYLLFHELLCHGYQSLATLPREEVGATCAWTEGWMDVLAAELAENWARNDASRPDWVKRNWRQVVDGTREMHGWRMSPQTTLRPYALSARQAAAAAAQRLRLLYQGAAPNSIDATQRLSAFSLRLNLDTIAPTQRRELEEALSLGLEEGALLGADLDALVFACSRYAQSGNWQRLLADLNELVPPAP